MITLSDFQKVDIRVGKIIQVDDFPEAKIPSYKLKINFGKEIGIKKSCARFIELYTKKELLNKQVLCVINLPPRQIGPAVSEVLTLGLPNPQGYCFLIQPDREAELGSKLY